MIGSRSLVPVTEFVITKHSNNINAGEDVGLVTITGVGAFKDSEVGTFTITKKQVTLDDLKIATYNTDYTGKEQPIQVGPKSGLSGLGVVTASYTPDTLPRVGAGSWTVVLSIAEGANFQANERVELTQVYKINKIRWNKDEHLNYTTVEKLDVWNGTDKGGVAVPTTKGVASNYTGTLRVVYEANGIEYPTAIGDSLVSTVYTVKAITSRSATSPSAPSRS